MLCIRLSGLRRFCSSMDIWSSSMDELHGRLVWTTFTVSVGCPCTVPSWVILRPNGSVSPGRILGRTRDGLIFLLSYQLPLCSRGRPGYCCDFRGSFAFCEPRVAKPLVGRLCRSHFPKDLLRVILWMANVASVTLLRGPINSTILFPALYFPLNLLSVISSKSLV